MLNIDLIKESLRNNTLVNNVHYFEEIASTNDFAKSLDGEDMVLVITEYQTAGHGRFDRKWDSEKGLNLTFSIKKLIDVSPKYIQSVNFFFSYYLTDGLKKFLREKFPVLQFDIFIKWPNDIILNSKKICGILVDSNFTKKEFTIGFGINVNQEKFGEEYSHNAASLKKFTGQDINATDLLLCLLEHFERNFNLVVNGHFDIIYKLWKGSNFLIGKDILFETPGHIKKNAKVIDFKEDGGIELETDNKKITYYSGDIKILKGWQ